MKCLKIKCIPNKLFELCVGFTSKQVAVTAEEGRVATG